MLPLALCCYMQQSYYSWPVHLYDVCELSRLGLTESLMMKGSHAVHSNLIHALRLVLRGGVQALTNGLLP